jgi:beta-glucosidase
MRSGKRLRNLSCLVIGVAAAAGGTLASVAPSAATASTPAKTAENAKSADSVPIYLNPAYPPAERAVIAQSHPASMMSAYNEVNGIPSPANVQLNQELARETYGFGGYFTSDCDAIYVMQAFHNWIPPNSTVPVNQYTRSAYANSAGEDLECNAGYQDSNNYGNTIPTALTQNIQTLTDTYNIGDVDTSLVLLFTARIETGEFDAEAQVPWVAKARAALGGVTWTNNPDSAITETPRRLQLAQDSADQSITRNPCTSAATPASKRGQARRTTLTPTTESRRRCRRSTRTRRLTSTRASPAARPPRS